MLKEENMACRVWSQNALFIGQGATTKETHIKKVCMNHCPACISIHDHIYIHRAYLLSNGLLAHKSSTNH